MQSADTRPHKITVQPDYYEPYAISQGIKVGDLVFLSGQAGLDQDGNTVPGGFEAQARRAFANIAAVLTNAGARLSDVVKVTILVTDMSHLDTVIKLRTEYFTEPYPADTLVQVAGLAQPDWLVEIDAMPTSPHHPRKPRSSSPGHRAASAPTSHWASASAGDKRPVLGAEAMSPGLRAGPGHGLGDLSD